MAIESERLAREIHTASADMRRWEALPEEDRERLRKQAVNLMGRLLISPREQAPSDLAGSVDEAARRGFHGALGQPAPRGDD